MFYNYFLEMYGEKHVNLAESLSYFMKHGLKKKIKHKNWLNISYSIIVFVPNKEYEVFNLHFKKSNLSE